VIGSVLVVGSVAEAETFGSVMSARSGMYDCTSDAAVCTRSVAVADPGLRARMVCWEDGRVGAGQRRWFYVRLANGRQGFVPASRVARQTSVRWCRDANASNEIDGVIAARWALGRAGVVSVTAAERSRLSAITGVSENHTLGDWSGDCIGFAVLGWDRAGRDRCSRE
jgi:hypothetical protein